MIYLDFSRNLRKLLSVVDCSRYATIFKLYRKNLLNNECLGKQMMQEQFPVDPEYKISPPLSWILILIKQVFDFDYDNRKRLSKIMNIAKTTNKENIKSTELPNKIARTPCSLLMCSKPIKPRGFCVNFLRENSNSFYSIFPYFCCIFGANNKSGPN